MDAAAAQLTDALSQSKQTKIVVFDFAGPDGEMTALGESLADDFSHALSLSDTHLNIADRSLIRKIASKEHFARDAIYIPALDVTFAYEMKVKAFVSGTISLQGSDVNVVVKAARAPDSKTIASVSFSLALTGESSALIAKTLADAPVPAFLDPDDKEISLPKCIFCPRAEYSFEALAAKAQGAVILEAVVGTDGTISQMQIIKPLDGLTAPAIQAVSRWRLRPAMTHDGRPVAVREIIQVSFQLF